MIPSDHLAPFRSPRTVALALLCVLAVGLAAAAGGYALDSPDATSVPERSEEFQGQIHTVDSQISADPGDTVTVDVTAPDESYRVYIYNSDGQFEDDSRETGTATVEFDLSGYDPGSYVVATRSNDDGIHTAFLPLLVRGYAVDASAPDEATADDTFEVTIDVTATAASGSPAGVRAVLANGETNHSVQATGSDGSYVATVDAGEVPTGEYTVYGAVQGDETAFGQQELVGIGEAGTLSISESAEATPTETETESGGSGGSGGAGGGAGGAGSGGGSGEAPAGETNATETGDGDTDGESTETGTQTRTETTAGDGSGSGGSAADGSSPTTAADSGEEGVSSGAITPNGTSTTDAGTTGADGPGFGPVQALVALGAAVAALAAGRRRRRD